MPRYRPKPAKRANRQEYVEDLEGELILLPDIQVDDSVDQPTGLYNARGNELVRQPNRIGFLAK